MKTCEVCGAPDAFDVWDIRETEPITTEKGERFRAWEQVGEPHSLCEAHRRTARVTERTEPTGTDVPE